MTDIVDEKISQFESRQQRRAAQRAAGAQPRDEAVRQRVLNLPPPPQFSRSPEGKHPISAADLFAKIGSLQVELELARGENDALREYVMQLQQVIAEQNGAMQPAEPQDQEETAAESPGPENAG